MNKKYLTLTIVVVILIAAAALLWPYRGILRNITPTPTPSAPSTAVDTTGLGLTLPDGFSISTFAKDLPGARVIVFDSFGNAWVSQPSEGIVTTLEIKDGAVMRQNAVFKDLQKPHGLALDGTMLYIAEEDKISRVPLYSDGQIEKIADLPSGRGHSSRTIGFGPDGRLYVSIGSSCNVCNEADNRRAKIFSMNKDGSDIKEFARGLRNAVFFTWENNRMWATEMGRDNLGDDLPPDEINVIQEGRDYGWPLCYGKNVFDTEFGPAATGVGMMTSDGKEPCDNAEPSTINLQAHSAPLGLAFTPDSWGSQYRDNLLVAYHGSWNRSVPTGYKIVRFAPEDGTYKTAQDFITGFIKDGTVYGRPVELVFGPDGALYITDDRAGAVYRLTHQK